MDNQLLNLSQGFDRGTIIAIENAYIISLVKFTPQDTDAILILFKQAVSLGNASNLSNNIVVLSNSSIVPSAYNIYGIVGTNGVSSAVIALSRGIPAPVMKRLGDLGIKTTDYERLGIKSKEISEGVAEAENVLKKIIEKYSDDVMKHVYKEGKYIPSDPQTLVEYDKLDKIASDMYNKFRASTDDVSKVAKNTGWDINDVQQIKNHLFIDGIKFASGEVKQFPPDYEQAVAWERLINGQFYESDILLIKHELYESTYMRLNACVQDIAHEATNKVFNWAELLKKLLGGK